MRCPNCQVPLEENAVFCGNCGYKVAPVHAQGATIAEPTQLVSGDRGNSSYPQTYAGTEVSSRPPYAFNDYASTAPSRPPIRPTSPQNRSRRIIFIASVIIVLILVVTAGFITLWHGNGAGSGAITNTGVTPTIQVSFTGSASDQLVTDKIIISASNLQAPPANSQYFAWLVDQANEQIYPLGKLNAQPNGTYSDIYIDPNHRNLLGLGNMVEITRESGEPVRPTNNAMFSATIPEGAFVHIQHLLVNFQAAPHHVGLIVGLRDQVQKLHQEAIIMQNLGNNGKNEGVRCAAQVIVNIVEGSDGRHYNQLPQACDAYTVMDTSDGYGVLGQQGKNSYIYNAQNHASLASQNSGNDELIKIHAKHVQICLDNLLKWIQPIDRDAEQLLNNPNNINNVNEIVTDATNALNGINKDADESIDPVPGEGTTLTAYTHAQLMATLKPVAP